MEKIIKNTIIQGEVSAPPSKSQTIRAFAASSLCSSESIINNYSDCDDALAALGIIKALGSELEFFDDYVKIIRKSPPIKNILNCRESAFCLRLFSAIASIYDTEFEFVAEKTLLKRKTGDIEDVLKSLGVECKTDNGFPPIKVRGHIKGGNIKIDCSISSQLLSGLLFSLPLANSDSIIEASNLKSKPYIDMTLDILSRFKVEIKNENYKRFIIKGGQNYYPVELTIEGDWSCASNFLVAGAIAGQLSISNLNLNSFQGDKIIFDILKKTGADVNHKNGLIHVSSGKLKSFDFDAGDCPDLVPILAVLGCYCEGTSGISDISRLAGKESSRAEIIASELNSVGGKIQIEHNVMFIENAELRGGTVNSHGDHRIAMALAVSGLKASSTVTIKDAECVSKSYPDFWKDFERLLQ